MTVIAASFIAVLVLQALDTRTSSVIALLYVMPIALAAVAFGLRGGLSSAASAYAAFGIFALGTTGDLVDG